MYDAPKVLANPRAMGWLVAGFYYGFPTCCIAAFLAQDNALTQKLYATQKVPFPETGYIPCPVCANRTEKELREEIQRHRLAPGFFPDDESDINHSAEIEAQISAGKVAAAMTMRRMRELGQHQPAWDLIGKVMQHYRQAPRTTA